MTVRYVGLGGNDANSGLSWALRKLTLNGMEDTPVAAGDTVYVGPGTYRETLTVDVSGTAGNVISYIGDYTGANTDGVGGVVRITGSNNDQTATRSNAVTQSSKNYRTFTNFLMDSTAGSLISLTGGCTNFSFSKCLLADVANAQIAMNVAGAGNNISITDCVFFSARGNGCLVFTHSSTVNDSASSVSNSLFLGAAGQAVTISRIGGITVRNCTMFGHSQAVIVAAALAAGQTTVVNNCLILNCLTGLSATAVGEITEDYNNIYGCNAARSNTNTGAHSVAYPSLLDARWFFQLVNASAASRVVTPFDLASYSQLVNVAGTSPTATDMRGTAVQGAQREWGALEYDSTLKIASGSGGAVSISPFRGNIG